MNATEWVRFALLTALAGWSAWGLLQWRGGSRAVEAVLPAGVALLAAGQFILQAQQATDALTGLGATLPALLTSGYGILTAVLFMLSAAATLWLLLKRSAPRRLMLGSALLGLILAAGAANGANGAATALASSGEVAMSPTLLVPRSALNTPNPYANDPNSAERGRIVYQQYCAACHGITGDGRGPAGANLKISPANFHVPQHYLAPGMDGAHFWVVQHGDGLAGGMPAWQGTLTDQQTWDVIDYIKQIAAGTANTSQATVIAGPGAIPTPNLPRS